MLSWKFHWKFWRPAACLGGQVACGFYAVDSEGAQYTPSDVYCGRHRRTIERSVETPAVVPYHPSSASRAAYRPEPIVIPFVRPAARVGMTA